MRLRKKGIEIYILLNFIADLFYQIFEQNRSSYKLKQAYHLLLPVLGFIHLIHLNLFNLCEILPPLLEINSCQRLDN